MRAGAGRLKFGPPVAFAYSPAIYARDVREAYLRPLRRVPGRVLLRRHEPGSVGHDAQTGVPFGDPEFVRNWLGLEGRVQAPRRACVCAGARARLAATKERHAAMGMEPRARYGEPSIGSSAFIWSHCPLCFLDAGGANVTPDKIAAATRAPFAVCNEARSRP